MTIPSFLDQLSQLEATLTTYSLQELGIADAARLRKAFSAFKERIEAKLWAKEEREYLEDLSAAVNNAPSTIPLLQHTPNTATNQVHHKSAAAKAQILLAEHDTRVAAFFIKHLHKAGYDVLWASHASMAKTLFRNAEPAIAICSVYAASSFGSEVIKYIRQPEQKHIPVILVAGAEHSDGLREAISLGAEDYLAQHITAAEIVGKIKRALK
ncbi:MAG: response regulator [Flavobacteriaceae bacterium]|nr:response regulator [Flavobacteriaceae bacterium]